MEIERSADRVPASGPADRSAGTAHLRDIAPGVLLVTFAYEV